MLVEEVPKSNNPNSRTIYFSSSINLSARSTNYHSRNDWQGLNESHEDNNANRLSKSRPKVNYNVTQLMNAQTHANDSAASRGPLKSAQQIHLERIITKRLNDLIKTSPSANFDLPKNFSFLSMNSASDKKKSKQGSTPGTRKILSSRRTLNLYFEEESNVLSINSILSLNFQFVDQIDDVAQDGNQHKSRKVEERSFKPRLKLCCICGIVSNYSRCRNCGLFTCSVKCNRLHEDLRCN